MATRPAHRAHDGAIAVGDRVPPSENFVEKLISPRREIEDLFEERRPADKPARRSAVFLFELEHDARDWCLKHRSRSLIEVDFNDAQIGQRRDWQWFDRAMELGLGNIDGIRVAADAYWRGEPCGEIDHGIWELLVKESRVIRELNISAEERQAAEKKVFGMTLAEIASQFHLG